MPNHYENMTRNGPLKKGYKSNFFSYPLDRILFRYLAKIRPIYVF